LIRARSRRATESNQTIMDAQKFANELRQLAPPAEKLAENGISQEEIERTLKSYLCIEKKGLDRQDNPVLDLITRYDLSSVEIGMVRFTDTLIVQGGSMCIGEFEVDPILMDITSGEIYIVDWAARNHIMWWCAKNGDSFLDALILAERHLSRCGYDYTFADDQTAACEVASNCAEAAGGRKYLDFYKVLVACF
jgi:hypothetical protein